MGRFEIPLLVTLLVHETIDLNKNVDLSTS